MGPNGDVWRARRHGDGTVVALKRVSGAGPDVRDRLRRVAAVVGSSDPRGDHVLAVHDVGSNGADVVIVRDLASGGSLAALLTRRRLSAGELVTLVAPLARAL